MASFVILGNSLEILANGFKTSVENLFQQVDRKAKEIYLSDEFEFKLEVFDFINGNFRIHYIIKQKNRGIHDPHARIDIFSDGRCCLKRVFNNEVTWIPEESFGKEDCFQKIIFVLQELAAIGKK